MDVVVLVVTLFFYGADKPPKTAAFLVPSQEDCSQLAGDAMAQIPAIDKTVRDVEPKCFTVTMKDET